MFDVVHPAHVHFFRHLIGELNARGDATLVIARDKDVTLRLLERFRIPAVVVGRAPTRAGGRGRLAIELAERDVTLVRAAREFQPDVVLTRNPAGVQAARVVGVPGVFDTDDGKAVGLHFHAARPFASWITTPDCLRDDYGPKHLRYPSYKALAFLHPARFEPDPLVLGELGVAPGEPYAIVRFVALAASHDRRERGLSTGARRELVARLARHGRVFVSSESPLPCDLAPFELPITPDRLHDALAWASLCVTDGQSIAGEAAVLGVPSVRASSFARRLDVFRDLHDRYQLVWEYDAGEERAFFAQVEALAAVPQRERWIDARRRLLTDKCDLTSWMLDALDQWAA
jgi:predicted glycosyltransferase